MSPAGADHERGASGSTSQPLQCCLDALQDEVVPPSAVRDGDLVGAVWPPGSTLRRPQLGAAAQMAPVGAALDFHPPPGGAAQWCAAAAASLSDSTCMACMPSQAINRRTQRGARSPSPRFLLDHTQKDPPFRGAMLGARRSWHAGPPPRPPPPAGPSVGHLAERHQ